MSDIVTLTNKRCQAGCQEDDMRVRTTETLAPLMRLHRKFPRADLPKHKQNATGFGI